MDVAEIRHEIREPIQIRIERSKQEILRREWQTRTRTNTIPDGTKASAAGLSGCACVTRMRSGEKGEVRGKRGSARRLNG